jgi:site-specific recombinase XerD
VTGQTIQQYLVWFLARHSKTYANNQYRALQQFWKWYAEEEDQPNPLAGLRPPKPDEDEVPVITDQQWTALITDAERGRDFVSRRDAAILRYLACTGCRLAETAGLRTGTLSVRDRAAVMIGKGGKKRTVQFDLHCAQAIDRYLRQRARHKYTSAPQL